MLYRLILALRHFKIQKEILLNYVVMLTPAA